MRLLPTGPVWITGTAIEGAISSQTPVRITYTDAFGVTTTRTIEPREVALTREGNLICRAADRRSGQHRAFRLDRIEGMRVLTGEHFDGAASDAEMDALARIRAEIALIPSEGFSRDGARWTPDPA